MKAVVRTDRRAAQPAPGRDGYVERELGAFAVEPRVGNGLVDLEELDVGRQGSIAAYQRSCFKIPPAMTRRWISEVPSTIVSTRACRYTRSMPLSRRQPEPPWIWIAS